MTQVERLQVDERTARVDARVAFVVDDLVDRVRHHGAQHDERGPRHAAQQRQRRQRQQRRQQHDQRRPRVPDRAVVRRPVMVDVKRFDDPAERAVPRRPVVEPPVQRVFHERPVDDAHRHPRDRGRAADARADAHPGHRARQRRREHQHRRQRRRPEQRQQPAAIFDQRSIHAGIKSNHGASGKCRNPLRSLGMCAKRRTVCGHSCAVGSASLHRAGRVELHVRVDPAHVDAPGSRRFGALAVSPEHAGEHAPDDASRNPAPRIDRRHLTAAIMPLYGPAPGPLLQYSLNRFPVALYSRPDVAAAAQGAVCEM